MGQRRKMANRDRIEKLKGPLDTWEWGSNSDITSEKNIHEVA